MSSEKYLLITSDDFGMCHAINAGIVRAMAEGIVTSTTLMAPCPWFSEAVSLVKKHHLKAGVHLCLTCEWDHLRWGPITQAPSLIGSDGYFPTSFPDLAESATDDDVAREYDAQIMRVLAYGIEPTHIDVHMLAPDDGRKCTDRFKEQVRNACQRHGLTWIRDYAPASGLIHLTDQIGSSGLSAHEFWQGLEKWNKPGFYHVISHVAENHPELNSICSQESPAREWGAPYRSADMRLLGDEEARRQVEKLGFKLVDVPTFFKLKQSL